MNGKLSRIGVYVLPCLLLALGVYLLIGCIPIPATHLLQPSGRPRPEFYVGDKTDKPVQIGHTHIVDAIIAIDSRVSQPKPSWAFSRWQASDNGRQFAVVYEIRTAT